MKRYFKLLMIICFFAIPIVSFAQRNFYQAEKLKSIPEKKLQEKREWLINNSDYIVEGGTILTVGSFVYNNEVYTIRKIQVLHIYRGTNVPQYIFFVHKNPNFKPTTVGEFPYVHQSDPIYPYFFQLKGVFFLKKNTVPITLPDTSKLKNNFEFQTFPDFYLNPTIYFDPEVESNNIFQPMDEDEFGLSRDDVPDGMMYYGLYDIGFKYNNDMFYFLHQYDNIKIPYEEYFLQEWEEERNEKLSREKQDSTIKKKGCFRTKRFSKNKRF